jgi:hypothetical protein
MRVLYGMTKLKLTDRDLVVIDNDLYVSRKVASVICNVTQAQFGRWLEGDNPPPYDEETRLIPLMLLGEWTRARQTRRRGRGSGPSPYAPMPVDYDEHPDLRLKKLQGDKVQMELMEKAKLLVSVDEIKPMWERIVTRVRTKLLRLPVATAPLVTGETDQYAVQNTLDGAVREILEELATDDPVDDLELP